MAEKRIIVPRFKKENGFVTTLKRSELMSKIKAKDTSPELIFRKALWRSNVRYRIHNKQLPGNPDIVNASCKLAVFIDGEFWHGFEWEKKKAKLATNRDFWIPKIERNMQRDKENTKRLVDLGFTVFRFWERQIKKDLQVCVAMIVEYVELCRKPTVE